MGLEASHDRWRIKYGLVNGLPAITSAAQTPEPSSERQLTDLQSAVATYLYLPQFSFPEFASQVFRADVSALGYDPVSRHVYLSVPAEQAQEEAFLRQLSQEPM